MSNGVITGSFSSIRRDLAFLAAILIQTFIIGWLVIEVSQMKGNRFTSSDGLAIWKALSSKADAENVPPRWFREEVQRLENRIQSLEDEH